MEVQKHRKSSLSSLILFLVVFISSFSVRAENDYAETSTTINDALVKDIIYTYQLVYRSNGTPYCEGSLEVMLDMPPTVKSICFKRTMPNSKVDFSKYNFWQGIAYYDPDVTSITRERVQSGTAFKVSVLYTDEHKEESPIYYINDLISEEDLRLLEQSADIGTVDANSVSLTVKDRILHVGTTDNIFLSVHDLYGKTVFSGDISESTEIPLDSISSPFIIVKYTDSETTQTTKLLVQ